MADPLAPLIDELIDVGHDAARRGLVLASAGNLSARLPGGEAFAVTAAGTWFDRLAPGDFSILALDGTVLDGNPRPSTEWKLHARTYEVRPDVTCVIHLHPQAAVILDACGHQVRLITLDHAYYLGKVARVPFAHNGSDELADTAAEAARGCNAIIMGNHGCSTLGDTIAMAYRRALQLEDAAESTFRCLAHREHGRHVPAGGARGPAAPVVGLVVPLRIPPHEAARAGRQRRRRARDSTRLRRPARDSTRSHPGLREAEVGLGIARIGPELLTRQGDLTRGGVAGPDERPEHDGAVRQLPALRELSERPGSMTVRPRRRRVPRGSRYDTTSPGPRAQEVS